ncbi:MliC family protein [Marinobacterium marinum]|uniref:MliC family protein n=1 Tax=Marinobacterium marinum TaxID=2756129 RepID=A0A7W2AB39_9GAMM|nr:MliC family protein [Marinobacterium marinum]MBA4502556.1 MliC family protein [Marinobacterium marinum]
MFRWLALSLAVASTLGCVASAPKQSVSDRAQPTGSVACTDAWYESVEQRVGTGDGQGHGPDWGSDEWKSVVEFKLGVRGAADMPELSSPAWCGKVEQLLRQRQGTAQGPSFECDADTLSAAEKQVCNSAELSALDRQLGDVYQQSLALTEGQGRKVLQAEQRGWIKGRDECWKSGNPEQCVDSQYRLRIAALQAQYRLVEHSEPVRYQCGGNPGNEFVATYFQTEPSTVIVEHGDSVSLMYNQPAASGAKYQGRNASLWERRGGALIRWGADAPEMECTQK